MTVTATTSVLLVEDQAEVRVLTLNRPDRLNALDTALTRALTVALEDADADTGVRAVVLAGAGRAFCAGADLTEFAGLTPDEPDAVLARAELTARLQTQMQRMGTPVVSAVRGAAVGGGAGLAIGADMVVAGTDLKFGYPELRHSLVPALVMTGLQRQLGRKLAFELISTGRLLGAAEADRHGLVNRVVEPDEVLPAALEIARGWAGVEPKALRAAKELFYRVADLPTDAAMRAGQDVNALMRGFPAMSTGEHTGPRHTGPGHIGAEHAGAEHAGARRPPPLAGITVLDFSRVLAAPLATQVLAELGATVVKVERPGGGDETRSFEPRLPQGESAYFFAVNRGKRSVTLDLKSPRGQEVARRLAGRADVVVENFLPGTMERLGLSYAKLAAGNPGLVYVSATGFGQTGPDRDRKGYDTIFQALSGVMAMTGAPAGPPAKAGVPVADLTSGLWVLIAVLTGLAGRAVSGQGRHLDVAMMDVQLSLHALNAARLFARDEDPAPNGTEHPGRVPSAAFRAADGGWLHISGSDQHWAPLCAVLGLDALAADPTLRHNAGRVAHRDRVMRALTDAIGGRDRDRLVKELRAADVPVGEVRGVREALADPHAVARGVVAEFHHPTEGSFPALRTPLRDTGGDPPEIGVPPLLGADTDTVLAELAGLTPAEIEGLRTEGVI